MQTYDEIYKYDSAGKVRVWFMRRDGSRHQVVSGLKRGKVVTSEWTQCQPTNVGRSNERNAEAQAEFEIEAAYKDKLSKEYHRTIAEAGDKGAHYFKPMLAQKYEAFQPGYTQPKLDGVRCIARRDGLFTREGKTIPGADHVHQALTHLFLADPALILDGELYNHAFKDDFNTIVGLVRRGNPDPSQLAQAQEFIQYHIYDLPSCPGNFIDRHNMLTKLYGAINEPCIQLVGTHHVSTEEAYDTLHGHFMEEGYEGSMFRLNAPYEQKRSKTLLKRKEFQDEEFECVRIEEGLGNWAGVAKRVVCRLPDGREFGAGIKGTRERAASLLHELHTVVTIKYFARTPDGIPRFPVAIKFHGENKL